MKESVGKLESIFDEIRARQEESRKVNEKFKEVEAAFERKEREKLEKEQELEKEWDATKESESEREMEMKVGAAIEQIKILDLAAAGSVVRGRAVGGCSEDDAGKG